MGCVEQPTTATNHNIPIEMAKYDKIIYYSDSGKDIIVAAQQVAEIHYNTTDGYSVQCLIGKTGLTGISCDWENKIKR